MLMEFAVAMRNGILKDLRAREMFGIVGECLGLFGKHWQPPLVLAAVQRTTGCYGGPLAAVGGPLAALGDHWPLWGTTGRLLTWY